MKVRGELLMVCVITPEGTANHVGLRISGFLDVGTSLEHRDGVPSIGAVIICYLISPSPPSLVSVTGVVNPSHANAGHLRRAHPLPSPPLPGPPPGKLACQGTLAQDMPSWCPRSWPMARTSHPLLMPTAPPPGGGGQHNDTGAVSSPEARAGSLHAPHAPNVCPLRDPWVRLQPSMRHAHAPTPSRHLVHAIGSGVRITCEVWAGV